MKRRLVKCANNSFTVTLAKDYVMRNNLEENKDLILEDLGETILIKPDKEFKKKTIELSINQNNIEVGLIKLKKLYQHGYNEISLNVSDEVRGVVDKTVSELWGINHYIKDNKIVIYDEKHQNECTAILQKCFEEILQIATHVTEHNNTESWRDTLDTGYKKVLYRISFVHRLLNTNSCKCLKQFQKYQTIAVILELIAKKLKSIGCKLSETSKKESLIMIKKILKVSYKVCFKDHDVSNLLNMINSYSIHNKECWLCNEYESISAKCKSIIERMVEV